MPRDKARRVAPGRRAAVVTDSQENRRTRHAPEGAFCSTTELSLRSWIRTSDTKYPYSHCLRKRKGNAREKKAGRGLFQFDEVTRPSLPGQRRWGGNLARIDGVEPSLREEVVPGSNRGITAPKRMTEGAGHRD